MYTIIQEKLKRINSRLSPMISASILGSLLIIVAFLFGRESIYFGKGNNEKKQNSQINIANVHSQNDTEKQSVLTNTIINDTQSVGRIYASSKGKKYYIEGICDGNISPKNKVYYKDESVAIKSGKAKAAGCI